MSIEQSINMDITKIKGRLIKRANKGGIWENFGQKEFRGLMDKYGRYLYDDEVNTKPIFDFNDWCMNYDGG